ncbi:MAG: hypothetical protein IPM54_06565 [Polyangiaceae bacterium]|nr:hypothetical protein [Polyangiaceae bacterium]
MPWVDVPDISDVPGAFDAGKDPYADYADAVIASLKDYVSGGVVIGRASFVAEVRAWRSNQAALEKAIKARMSVSQAEVNAFLNAQNKVTTYLQQFMDQAGWLHDANVPPDVKANVDGVLKNFYADQAEQLKDRLNELANSWAPEVSNPFFDTVRAFAAGMSAISEGAHDFKDVMQTIVHGATRIGIGFVPFAGPALDICEAVTGKEWCLPSGRVLSTEERILSGVGFGVGKIVKVWKGVSSAAISTEGKLAAAGIVSLTDEVAEALHVARLKTYKGLSGSAKPLANDFEKKAALYLMKDKGHKMLGVGDDGVRDVLNIPRNAHEPGVSRAPDFVSVSPEGGIVLSEAKGIETGSVDALHAVSQLENAMKKVVEENLTGEIKRVQLIKPAGAKLKDNYTVKDGYLRNGAGKTVTMPGRPNLFVRVVEL